MNGKFEGSFRPENINIQEKGTGPGRTEVLSMDSLKKKLQEVFHAEPASEFVKPVEGELPSGGRTSLPVILEDGTEVNLPKPAGPMGERDVPVTYGAAGETSTETKETAEAKKGGSYKDVRVEGEGDRYEVHHMPADSASNLERNDGPAIKMDKEDHRRTASCGMSQEAREYRERQKELIDEGKFREALQMDIDDIREKFGDKYDDAIEEMLAYVDQLEEEGRI